MSSRVTLAQDGFISPSRDQRAQGRSLQWETVIRFQALPGVGGIRSLIPHRHIAS